MSGGNAAGTLPSATAGLRPQTNACRTTIDLSGLWTLRFDDRDWHAGIRDGVPVGVPGSWNDQLPGARDELGPAW